MAHGYAFGFRWASFEVCRSLSRLLVVWQRLNKLPLPLSFPRADLMRNRELCVADSSARHLASR